MCREQGNKLVVDIVVSHGFFVDETRRILAGKAQVENWSFYCATTAYRLEAQASADGGEMQINRQMIHDGEHGHIVTRD